MPKANNRSTNSGLCGEPPRLAAAFALPWLLYTGFFFLKFFYVTPPAWEVALSAAVIVAFLSAYVAAVRNYYRPARLRVPSAIILGLGVIMAPLNPGANVFFMYPAWFLARAYPTRQALAAIALIATIVIALTLAFDLSANFFLPALLVTAGLGPISLATRRYEETQEALTRSRKEAEHLARIAERERIARDMHDTVGHTLSVIALKSDLAAQLVGQRPDAAAEEIREINAVARQALGEIRATLSGYRELSLEAELEALSGTLSTAGIECRRNIAAVDMPAHIESALAMVFREAVTNVIRHSRAGICTLALGEDGADVVARIHDDGIGVQHEAGNGLTGMRQRIEQIAGSLDVSSDSGTRLTVRLPLAGGQRP